MVNELKARMEANLEAAREALEAARADPWVKGSTGQLKAHPGFSVAAGCDAAATKLAVELRLQVAARPAGRPDPFADLDGDWDGIYGDNPFDALAARGRRKG